MGITVVGVNHRTAPIEVRERLTRPLEDVHPVLADVATHALASRFGSQTVTFDEAWSLVVDVDLLVWRRGGGQLAGVILYDVDDLDAAVEAGVNARCRKEIPAAERIVEAETGRFWALFRGREAKETITTLRHRLEAVRDQELQATIGKLGDLPPSDTRRIAHLTRTLVNRFLHEPTLRLQQAAGNGKARELSDALASLFDLKTQHAPEGEEDE